jgi:hypothetical protein
MIFQTQPTFHKSIPGLPAQPSKIPHTGTLMLCLVLLFSANAFSQSTEEAGGEAATPVSQEAITIPVPEGQDVMGIRIPHHNANGELIMLITAEVARRADGEEVEMERMKIDLWDEDRAHSWLEMPKSRFNMGSRILSGNDGALIEREDFRIEGQNLEFDLAAQKGIMRGKVTMTIKQAEQLTQ